jgi:LmbE family N-acetylglucosaminyl deacetylase
MRGCRIGAVALACALAALSPANLAAQDGERVQVLIVIAHPDDEAMFAATVYKITHFLDGDVDLALITDGSGGYRYSQLAEPIYGLELTDEEVAREYLPAIRRRELLAGDSIIGIRDHFFLDQYDHAYTTNVDTVLSHVWDAEDTRARLAEIMTRGDYDFVFVHLPVPNFHAHHKAATILALQAAGTLPSSVKPIVLGSFVGVKDGPDQFGAAEFLELEGYPITRVKADIEPFIFDLDEPLNADGRLNYKIVVNWLIAEHKSQGTMQLLMNQWDIDRFWFFDANDPAGLEPTRALFERLKVPAVAPAAESGGTL